jgi:hypothetical protein
MRINVFGAKSAWRKTLQISVKKNTCFSRNVTKTCFFDALIVGGRGAAIGEAGIQFARMHPGRAPSEIMACNFAGTG